MPSKDPHRIDYSKWAVRKDKGSVTFTKKGGKYDIGENPDYDEYHNDTLRGVSGSSFAKTIRNSKDPEDTARVMRKMAKKEREENSKKKKKGK